ncbi:MAG: hypothetical protein HYR62_07860 [Actinobacteria bacterium]|nr:hypothetical protein [Actinomycetota bacterium]MBI3687601.1 hypothetical protein [Actinomycetota bacterium]
MYRRLGYAGAWVVATSAGLTVALLCAGITTQRTDRAAPRVLSARTTPNVAGLPVLLTGPLTIGIPPGVPQASGSAAPSGSRADRESRERPQVAVPGGGSIGTAASERSQHPPSAQVRTYRARGGAATLRLLAGRLAVVAVAPQDGYGWRADQLPTGSVVVMFVAADRASGLYAQPGPGEAALPQPDVAVVEYSW